MKKSIGLLLSCVLLAGVIFPAGGASATTNTDVGIWYSTWYSKVSDVRGDWLTGFGASSLNQFVGDVNGDGKADAVTFNSGGIWNVALSNGSGFNTPAQWVSGHGSGSQEQFLSDVNGDGKADAVVFFNSDVNGDSLAGDWYISLSSGSGFLSYSLWKSGAGYNATRRLLGDVDGDGKEDLIAFFAADSGGKWAVALSNGSSFGTFNVWKTNFGGASSNQFVADTNKDGKADAIVYSSDGNWFNANSNGTAFGTVVAWTAGHGYGSAAQYAYDGNGDGYADAYVYFNADVVSPDGKVGDLIGREYERSEKVVWPGDIVLNSGFGYQATKFMNGNVTGDPYGWKANVAFYAGTNGGSWKVERYRQNDSVSTDTWLGFTPKPAINYRPLTLGSYQTYDSGNTAVIDEHLSTMAAAQIDWLLLDETNGLNNVSGAILNRAARLAGRLKNWNDNPSNRDIRYAFAIGRAQWTQDPLTIEKEAGQVWDEFANNASYGGSNYYYELNGKPLLVVYIPASVQTAWHNYTGSKANTNHFTVRFASNAAAGEYGWQLPQTGAVDNDEVMNVMPGWDNHVGNLPPVARNKGVYYSQLTWEKVLNRPVKPSIVLINSFNEFAEDTGVQISDTSGLAASSEKWYNSDGVLDPALYWNMTKNYIRQLQTPASTSKASSGFSSTQGVNRWSYEEWQYSGATRTLVPMTWDAVNGRWKGAAAYALIGNNWQHPDVNRQSVRVFTVPSSGSVTLTGNIAKQSASGNGVRVKIKKNDQDFWPSGGGYAVVTDTGGITPFLTATVAAGDKFQFIVDSNGAIDYDGTNWNPTVTYN
ncbi:FG-GAP-like repeat-containing protein [Cohnella silvisoli]|uniref:FG-GAP-like repeat-containing protein n=1 Tax=Cohnella silvisoli TaxID=2873699 RepID=A0ABV1KR97_9BACL|nr:FG-GAP-like repeat-containing protein [Cohnella silvisoli]MCD9021690.1 FG-GAP-like repeat-containing protein [Cohnella silvisoli]